MEMEHVHTKTAVNLYILERRIFVQEISYNWI